MSNKSRLGILSKKEGKNFSQSFPNIVKPQKLDFSKNYGFTNFADLIDSAKLTKSNPNVFDGKTCVEAQKEFELERPLTLQEQYEKHLEELFGAKNFNRIDIKRDAMRKAERFLKEYAISHKIYDTDIIDEMFADVENLMETNPIGNRTISFVDGSYNRKFPHFVLEKVRNY